MLDAPWSEENPTETLKTSHVLGIHRCVPPSTLVTYVPARYVESAELVKPVLSPSTRAKAAGLPSQYLCTLVLSGWLTVTLGISCWVTEPLK